MFCFNLNSALMHSSCFPNSLVIKCRKDLPLISRLVFSIAWSENGKVHLMLWFTSMWKRRLDISWMSLSFSKFTSIQRTWCRASNCNLLIRWNCDGHCHDESCIFAGASKGDSNRCTTNSTSCTSCTTCSCTGCSSCTIVSYTFRLGGLGFDSVAFPHFCISAFPIQLGLFQIEKEQWQNHLEWNRKVWEDSVTL